MNKLLGFVLGLAVILPTVATMGKMGIGTERDESIVRLYSDCPPEKRDAQGRCPRSHRNGYPNGGHRYGK